MSINGKINHGFEKTGSVSDLGNDTDEKVILRDSLMTEEEISKEKRSVWKNLIFMVLCNFLYFSPFLALTNSMTSLLQSDGVGATALTVGGFTQPIVTALFVTYLTKVIGIRQMVTITAILPLMFCLSFFYPIPAIAIPAGSFVGLIQGVYCSTTFLYGETLGFWYTKLTDGNLDTVMARMTGLINTSIAGGFLVGNVLLYGILNSASLAVHGNGTNNDTFEVCGNNYCNQDISHMTTMQAPDPWRYYTLIGTFSGMCIAGFILSFFLRDFSPKLGHVRRKKSDFFAMTKEMLLLLKDPRGYLLIVISLFVGIEEGFAVSDYTQAYISCTIGIPNVGLLMAGYGVAQVVINPAQWILIKYIGRLFTVLLGVSLLMGCFVALTLWSPNPDQIVLLAAVAFFWASGDALIVSTIFSVYGVLFEDNVEGSFAVGNVWLSIGFLISFGWGQLLCIQVKLFIMMGIAAVALSLFITLEVLIKTNKVIK